MRTRSNPLETDLSHPLVIGSSSSHDFLLGSSPIPTPGRYVCIPERYPVELLQGSNYRSATPCTEGPGTGLPPPMLRDGTICQAVLFSRSLRSQRLTVGGWGVCQKNPERREQKPSFHQSGIRAHYFSRLRQSLGIQRGPRPTLQITPGRGLAKLCPAGALEDGHALHTSGSV